MKTLNPSEKMFLEKPRLRWVRWPDAYLLRLVGGCRPKQGKDPRDLYDYTTSRDIHPTRHIL
jgi:hypothetical protein